MHRYARVTVALAVTTFVLVATSSLAGTLVVLNKSGASASLIDDETGKVVATVKTEAFPHEVAVSPDGRLAVGANYGNRENPGSTLTVIDIPAAKVIKTINLGKYQRPHGIQWLSDNKHVVVTVEANKALLKIDVAAGDIVTAVETGQETSHMVVVTPDGERAFVANIRSGSATAIDLENGKKLKDIVTGEGAEGIDVTPDGAFLWVTNRDADSVSVIDIATLEIVDTIDVETFPIRAKVTPDGKYVLVSCARSGDIAVIDAGTRKEVRRISFETEAKSTEGRLFGDQFGESSVPIGIVIRPDGKRAYVAHANADIISVIDLTTWKLEGVRTAGKEPDGMDYSKLKVGS
jgi:YVTN family beta-propeller protein